MAGRSRPTFLKRQKELARKEKQRAKADRRLQRKQEPGEAGSGPPIDDSNPQFDEPADGESSDATEEGDLAAAQQQQQ
jgi:hypothetical protein